MPVHRRPDPILPWLAGTISIAYLVPLVVLGVMAATLRDRVVTVLVFGLWELWLILLVFDWNELRSLLPPGRLRAPWWQGALKVTGYGLAGLVVAGLILSFAESDQQRAARAQWREGEVPAAFVITHLPAPAIASLLPAPLPEPPLPEPPPPEPYAGPPLLSPLQGPPLEAALAAPTAASARTQTAAPAAPAPPAPPPGPPPASPRPPEPKPADPKPATTQTPPPADPTQDPCFGRVKAFVTSEGRRLFLLPTWPDFLRTAATAWYCSEADARKAGYLPAPH